MEGGRGCFGIRSSEFGVRNFRPDKFFAFERNAPLEPRFIFCVPAEPVDGHGVEEFVGENHAVERRVTGHVCQAFPISEPANARRERFQRFPLPFLAARGGLDDAVFDPFEQFWPQQLQPGQNIPGQLSVMRAGFDHPR